MFHVSTGEAHIRFAFGSFKILAVPFPLETSFIVTFVNQLFFVKKKKVLKNLQPVLILRVHDVSDDSIAKGKNH